MRIDHFSTFPHGGAGTAARRLHQRLSERGVESRFNYWIDQDDQQLDDSYQQLEFPGTRSVPGLNLITHQLDRRRRRKICRHYDRHVRERPTIHELFTIPWALRKTPLDLDSLGSDIVHLHWLAFFVDYPSFFRQLPSTVPVVWSLHDMNPLTGGCHYSDGCTRFTQGCGNCPQISEPFARDVSWHAFRDKRAALRHKQIHIVTPNRWLSDLARQSPILPESTQFHLIPLGLEEKVFHPVEKTRARKELGLPVDRPLLAFGAEDIENYRKGFHHLLAALRHVYRQNPRVECLVFGNGRLPTDRAGLPRFREFGFVDQARQHRLIYSAADAFVLPSREDNQPQTGLEAMACGTPVIGFQAGGVPEYVRDGQTGLVAPLGDEQVMAAKISRLLGDPSLHHKLSTGARRMIEERHTAEQQARAYMDLYRKILSPASSQHPSVPANSRRAA